MLYSVVAIWLVKALYFEVIFIVTMRIVTRCFWSRVNVHRQLDTVWGSEVGPGISHTMLTASAVMRWQSRTGLKSSPNRCEFSKPLHISFQNTEYEYMQLKKWHVFLKSCTIIWNSSWVTFKIFKLVVLQSCVCLLVYDILKMNQLFKIVITKVFYLSFLLENILSMTRITSLMPFV